MFGSCIIFSSIWLYSKKCFGKYFLVFGCVAENNIENTFSSCSSHFLSFQTKPNQKKLINGAIWVKENPFVGVVGLTNGFIEVVGSSAQCEWIRWRSDASGFENDGEMISPVVRRSLYSLLFLFLSLSSRVIRKWRDDLNDQWLVSTRVGLNNRNGAIVLLRCDLLAPTLVIFLLFLSLSLLFSKAGNHLKWKWKRKSFSTILAIFYGQPGNAFQFDPIWSNNQTPTFLENHFRNQFEAKTNGASKPKYGLDFTMIVLILWISRVFRITSPQSF